MSDNCIHTSLAVETNMIREENTRLKRQLAEANLKLGIAMRALEEHPCYPNGDPNCGSCEALSELEETGTER